MIRSFALFLSLFICLGGLNASNQEVPFKLYPNPVTGDVLQVNFDFDFKPSQVYTFVITNVIGQVVSTHILSDEEVKKAYRKMAISFHPDKVATMGEEYQKGAKEKFQQIQDAYEAIKKRRGFK